MCDLLMVDRNPNPGDDEGCSILVDVDKATQDVEDMEMLEDDEGPFWGCPGCETDGNLIDVTSNNVHHYAKV